MSDIRILIVEDDPFIAMDIEAALLEIDVVGGKTFDVAASLLQSGTPFAFVSGSLPNDVPKSLRDVRFLRKPFSTREIASFVSSAVNVA
jgi:hypothetical protein